MKESGKITGKLEALQTSLGMTMLFMMVIFPNKVNPIDVQMFKIDFISLRIGKKFSLTKETLSP